MAVLEFYTQPTGDNRNAGTTSADAASVTSTNGDYGNAAANRFTAASGTPFSGVSVGDWVSISLDAATAAVFVAQVTAVNGGGASIDVSTTERYGTAPANGASGRSARVGGAWASLMGHSSVFTGSNTNPTSNVRNNVKATTYAFTTTSLSFGGALGTGLWGMIRGYKTTPGDMDAMPQSALLVLGTDIPHNTFTTGRVTAMNALWRIKNLSLLVTGATNNPVLTCGGGEIYNSFIEHQNANASSVAVSNSGLLTAVGSWFKTNAAANIFNNTLTSTFYGNTFVGGLIGLSTTATTIRALNNLLVNQASDAINCSGNLTNNTPTEIISNLIYNPTGHGINLSAAASVIGAKVNVLNNLFHTITQASKYAVNYGTTGLPMLHMHGNARYNVTNGMLNGTGDQTDYDSTNLSNDPLTNPSSGDFSFKTAEAARNAFPYLLAGYLTRTYLERGSVQSSGGGGSAPMTPMTQDELPGNMAA